MAFALITDENGIQDVIPLVSLKIVDDTAEFTILKQTHKVKISGCHDNYELLSNFAESNNSRKLKVLLERRTTRNFDIAKKLEVALRRTLIEPVGSIIPEGGPCVTGQECAAETIKPAASIVPEGGLILTGSIIPEEETKIFYGSGMCCKKNHQLLVPEGESVPGQESAEESLGSLFPEGGGSVTQQELPAEPTKRSYRRRVNNKENICKYCKKMNTNLRRHITAMHKNEGDVQKFMMLSDENPLKRKLLSQIRRDGNFSAFKEKENIVPARISRNTTPQPDDYMACPCCKILLKKESLRKHLKICPENHTGSIRGMMQQSRALTDILHQRANLIVKQYIFPALRQGIVKETIRFDSLLILYINELSVKYRAQHHYSMIRNKVIRMAKLLLLIKQEDPSINKFEDILNPRMFDKIVDAINKMGKYNEATRNYEKPTLPTEVGTSLKFIIQLSISEYIKNEDTEGKIRAENLLHLLKNSLPAHVNKTASESLLTLKRRKVPILPTTEDVKQLNTFLIKNRNEFYEKLSNNFNVKDWIELASYTLISILIFNRRRPGELERVLVSDLESITKLSDNSESYNRLSEAEKEYAKQYVRFVIRGKLARGVPVLLHVSMYNCIKILLRYREKTGINASNPYLFALPPSIKSQDLQVGLVHRHLSATTLLRKYSKACGAKNHSLLRATTLRKHVATKSMTLNLSSDEIHLLQGYLGHAEKIHREYYRQPIVEREILNISKVLLAAQSTSPSSSSVAGPSVKEREITSGSTASYPMTPTARTPIASFSRTTPIRSGVAGPSVTELEITSESTESLSRSTPIRNGKVCQSVTELEITSRSTTSYPMTPTARTTTASFSRTPIPGTSSTVSPIICTPAANCRRILQVPTTPMSTIPSDDDSDSVYYPSDKSDCELEVLATPKHRRRRIIACSPGQASKKRTWSTPERHAVLHIFSHHIANGTYPSIAEVIEATKGCDELKFRTIPQIKLWVSNYRTRKTNKTWTTPTRHVLNTVFKEYIEGSIENYPTTAFIKEMIDTNKELSHLSPRKIRSQLQQQKKKIRSSTFE
ncbi:hypothetical protein JTB14_012181 [Gonioctena quinquepunctata]|nr:hypothetical protein JTB14_012181 [Gonioctena quinquepunctata]